MFPRIVCLGFLVGLLLAELAHAEIPPAPADKQFLHDYANVVDAADRQRILNLQQKVFNEVQVPLVVVTVNRMGDYVLGVPSIESFATNWFNTWGIGTRQKNDGILVIISTGDRKGRIELGESWGRRFDNFSQRVMDNDMVPQFKKGDYSSGLVAAVEGLSVMAISGPRADPPKQGFVDQSHNNSVVKYATGNNFFERKLGSWILIVMMVAGLGFFIAAFLYPEFRKSFIYLGIVLIALAVIFRIVMIIFFLNMLRHVEWGSVKFEWGGGGGGFGGGSSGGGGASGSW